jgi:hypothetical protein
MLELNGKPSSVSTFAIDFSLQNLVFKIFSGRNHLKINICHILNPNLTKQIPLNPAHQDLSKQYHRHIPIPPKFSVKRSFNIQELLHHKSKCHGTKPMHPSSSRAFQRHQEHEVQWIS